MASDMKYSIIVPIYHDSYLAPAFCAEIQDVMSSYLKTDTLDEILEVIFINDGSGLECLNELISLSKTYSFIKVLDLSRNFGQHSAIACGFKEAKGEFVIRMNVDMQDPPSYIPSMCETMVKGDYDLVVGQYSERKSPWINKVTAHLYFRLFRFLTEFDAPQNTSPLRVMNRKFIDAYNSLTEKSRFPQGLDQWLGFRHKYVPIEHQERIDQKSSYNFWSRLILAINGILYCSSRPLTLVAVFGFIVATLGLLLALYIVIEKLLGYNFASGFASFISLGLIGFGIQLFCMGLIGIYISKTFKEVQNRPLYIIREEYTNGFISATGKDK